MMQTDLQTKHLDIALASLSKIYDLYHTQGLLSVYLWGSILRDEYNPENSDIDAVGIVEDAFPLELQVEINKSLEEPLSGLRDLRINLIRFSEINGASPTTRIATVIPPSLLLLEFDNWKHVAGKKFQRADFGVPIISTGAAMCLNVQVVLEHYLPKIESGDMAKWKSFVKQLMHICHLINKKDTGFTPFSYIRLKEEASSQDQEVVALLLKIKADKYRLPDEQEIEMIRLFIYTVRSTYCCS